MFTKSFRRPPAVFYIFANEKKRVMTTTTTKHQKAHHVNMKWYYTRLEVTTRRVTQSQKNTQFDGQFILCVRPPPYIY